MYYEHQARQPETALKLALDGLALSRLMNSGLEEDFEKRVDRLSRKLNGVGHNRGKGELR
jgi:hypothetical protein